MKSFSLLLFLVYFQTLFGQNPIVEIQNWNAVNPIQVSFAQDVEIQVNAPCTSGLSVVVGGGNPLTPISGTATRFLYRPQNLPQGQSSVSIRIACGEPANSTTISLTNTEVRNRPETAEAATPVGQFFSNNVPPEVARHFRNRARYNRKKNEAYLFLDQNGVVVGRKPVNLDEDDILYVYMMVKLSDISHYKIDITGDYAPDDLQIRPGELNRNAEPSPQAAPGEPAEWDLLSLPVGPFTSEEITLTINKKDGKDLKIVTSQTFTINNLYHLAVGASFINTALAKPEFVVVPLTTDMNTIVAADSGARTLVTMNVLWYWRPTIDWLFGRLRGEDHITRGRDVLKEPLFWERLNPTFGISLDRSFRENFFVGGTFEFARGGSIVAGWHYGRTIELLDRDFELGMTPYPGSQAEIRTNDVWRWSTFFGITLDHRIFNRFFQN